MRIDCPHCSAGYDLPPDKVPPGRAVRCARCTQLWTPVPVAAVPAAVVPGAEKLGVEEEVVPLSVAEAPADASALPVSELRIAAPTPDQALDAARRPAAASSLIGRMTLPGAWLLTVLVLATLGWAAVSRRAEIIHAWPPSERAYITFGLVPPS